MLHNRRSHRNEQSAYMKKTMIEKIIDDNFSISSLKKAEETEETKATKDNKEIKASGKKSKKEHKN